MNLGCWVKHENLQAPDPDVVGTCSSCNTLDRCKEACLGLQTCVSIIFTYPYYSNCDLIGDNFYTSGFSETYDLCAYGPQYVIINNLVIQPVDSQRAINLLEVQLFNNNVQIDRNLLTFRLSSEKDSTTFPTSNCNDGIVFGGAQYICHSGYETNPTLTIVSPQAFDKVVVYNRLDCCPSRINGATITAINYQVSKSTTFPGTYTVYTFLVSSSGLVFTP
jgi:hypothetical protein